MKSRQSQIEAMLMSGAYDVVLTTEAVRKYTIEVVDSDNRNGTISIFDVPMKEAKRITEEANRIDPKHRRGGYYYFDLPLGGAPNDR